MEKYWNTSDISCEPIAQMNNLIAQMNNLIAQMNKGYSANE
jgi:hypothetical protein